MTRLDWRRATNVTFGTARRTIGRAAFALGAIYAAFTIYYLIRPESAGAQVLWWFTGASALILLPAGLVYWRHRFKPLGCYVWIAAIAAIVLVNMNAALVASGDQLFGVSHMFAQLATAALAPTPLTFIVFIVVNLVVCLVISLAAGLSSSMDLAVLGFIMTTGVSVFIFIFRFRNISVMETLRQAVLDSRDQDFREIIEKNPDAVILVRDERVVYASAPLAQYLRIDDSSSLIGKKLSSLIVEGAENLERLLRGEWREHTCLVKLARRDGERVLVDLAEPKTITFGDAPAVMLVARDVTESQKALKARMLLADRMSAAGTLAAGMAHEINNPLTYATVNLSTLESRLFSEWPPPNEVRDDLVELVEEVRDGVERVAAIVEDLNGVARIGESEERSIDPLVALRTATKLVDNQLRHRTDVVCDLTPLPKVVANEGKLVQVFVNILINAAHAIDKRDASTNRIAISSLRRGDEVIIEITDSGSGMTEETRKRIFDPFFTTKEPGKGTGLGLFFCHSVIQSCGGQIEVESNLGLGTTVRIVLPSAGSNSGRVQPVAAERIERERINHPLSVLVIDDEPFVAKAIARVLADYDVTVANNGEDAIAEFAKNQHDLVLCDIMMPGVSGPQVYERMLELDPSVRDRVMFMTGGAFTPKARVFVDELEDRVLKKPVAVDALLDLAETVARKKAARRNL